MDIKWISGMNHLGMVESGTNSIYEFEVYVDQSGMLWFMDHEDPERPCSYAEVREFFRGRGDDLDAQLRVAGL